MGVRRVDTLGSSGGIARTGVASGSRGFAQTRSQTTARETAKRIEEAKKKDETIIVAPKTGDIKGSRRGSDISKILKDVRRRGGSLRVSPRLSIVKASQQQGRKLTIPKKRFNYVEESGLYSGQSIAPTDDAGLPISSQFTEILVSKKKFVPKIKTKQIEKQDFGVSFKGKKLYGKLTKVEGKSTINYNKQRENDIIQTQKELKKGGINLVTYKVGNTTLISRDKDGFPAFYLTQSSTPKFIRSLKRTKGKIQTSLLKQSPELVHGYEGYKEGKKQMPIAGALLDVAIGYSLGFGVTKLLYKLPKAVLTSKLLKGGFKVGTVIYSGIVPFRVVKVVKTNKGGKQIATGLITEFAGDVGFFTGMKMAGIDLKTLRNTKLDNKSFKGYKRTIFNPRNKPSGKTVLNEYLKIKSGTERAKFMKSYFKVYKTFPNEILKLGKRPTLPTRKPTFNLKSEYSFKGNNIEVINLKKAPQFGQKTVVGTQAKKLTLKNKALTGYSQKLKIYNSKTGLNAKTEYLPKKYTLLDKPNGKVELSFTVEGVIPKFDGNKITGYKNIGDIQVTLVNDKIVATSLKTGDLIEIDNPKKLFNFEGKTYYNYKGDWIPVDQLRTIGNRVQEFNKLVKKLNPTNNNIISKKLIISSKKKGHIIKKNIDGLVLQTIKMTDMYKDLGLTKVVYKTKLTENTKTANLQYKTKNFQDINTETANELYIKQKTNQIQEVNQKGSLKIKEQTSALVSTASKLKVSPVSVLKLGTKGLMGLQTKMNDKQKIITKTILSLKDIQKTETGQKTNQLQKVDQKTVQKQIERLMSLQKTISKINTKIDNRIEGRTQPEKPKEIILPKLPKISFPSIKRKKLDEEIEKIKKKGKKPVYVYAPSITGFGQVAKLNTEKFTGFEVRGNIIKLKPIKVKQHKRKSLKNKLFVRRHRRRKPRGG